MSVKPYWSIHTHSRFSVNDALPRVEHIVERAEQLGYPALGLTDHGNIAGAVSLYTACRKVGIEPLPGVELYVTDDSELNRQSNNHLTVVAYSEKGYRNLCKLATLTSRKFHYKPRVDMADFADLAEYGLLDGLAVSTGCYFGVAVQRLVTRGEQPARRIVDYLASCFPRCYVELQNHGIDNHEHPEFATDDDIVEAMLGIAFDLSLPVVIAQDSHYIQAEDRPLHDMLKQLVSWSDDVDDAMFPGDPYCLVDEKILANYFSPSVLAYALDGLTDLADGACVRIPELETFQMKVPDVTLTGDAQTELENRCWEAVKAWFPEEGIDEAYRVRLTEELEVIEFSQTAGMILLTAMVTDFMTASNIWFGARGSASGSLVLRLLGITQLDPVDRKLDFTRFLSRDRTKPPDIDLDVEHARRPEVAVFLAEHFSVAQVGTLMTYSVFDEEVFGDDTGGSLVKRYYTVRNKKGLPKITWKDIPADEKEAMEKLGKLELFSGYGKHPAGFVLAPDPATLAQLPLSYIASSQTHISAYYKKDVERLGFVKLDLLGLRDYTAFRIMGQALGYQTQAEFEAAIPLGDPAVYKRICKGENEGVFQLQGFSMNKGVQRLLPKNIDDLADAQALFRPAATGSGATADYLSRRKGRMKMPESRHADINSVTKDTFGVLLYQEQMVEVLRRMGLPPDELTEMLDAVKASNKYSAGAKVAIEAMLPKIREYAAERGWSGDDIQWLVDALIAFAEYCVTGDTVVWRSSGGNFRPQTMTVKEMHDIWHGAPSPTRGKYRATSRGLTILARDEVDNRIRPARVNGVRHAGQKPVWKVTTDSGHSITATANHRHLTNEGWKQVDELSPGDMIAVMGEPERFARPQGTRGPVGLHDGSHLLKREIKALGKCEFCGSSEGRMELAHLDGNRSNNTRENLRLLCNSCHKTHDWATGQRKVRHSRGRPLFYSPIISITDEGVQDVYDVSMLSADHSWVGNGIVTHNSFNKAHASSYADRAYFSAWGSLYHPTEFWLGLLSAYQDSSDKKKLPALTAAARRYGCRIRPAHVNYSMEGPALDNERRGIRKGLTSVSDVGPTRAREIVRARGETPYESLIDFGQRVNSSKISGAIQLATGKHPLECGGCVQKLYDAQAFDGLKGVS